MDYEFSFEQYNRPKAEFSMGHEAIGRWFTEELCTNQERIKALLQIIQQIEERHIVRHQKTGSEFQLRIEHDEVEVIALSLHFELDDELPEDTHLYEDEGYAECGLQDFKQALLSWQDFTFG